ncbi:hypothetical protein JB92DRAFT_2274409 [Gautieria morchelliformis]|nr:hypothetical protein JB92DRAFT_2274409 [Gautieria morchelliformis]
MRPRAGERDGGARGAGAERVGRDGRGGAGERGEGDGGVFADERAHERWAVREDVADRVHGPEADAEPALGDAASGGQGKGKDSGISVSLMCRKDSPAGLREARTHLNTPSNERTIVSSTARATQSCSDKNASARSVSATFSQLTSSSGTAGSIILSSALTRLSSPVGPSTASLNHAFWHAHSAKSATSHGRDVSILSPCLGRKASAFPPHYKRYSTTTTQRKALTPSSAAPAPISPPARPP